MNKLECGGPAMQLSHAERKQLPLIPKDLLIFKDAIKISYPKPNKTHPEGLGGALSWSVMLQIYLVGTSTIQRRYQLVVWSF